MIIDGRLQDNDFMRRNIPSPAKMRFKGLRPEVLTLIIDQKCAIDYVRLNFDGLSYKITNWSPRGNGSVEADVIGSIIRSNSGSKPLSTTDCKIRTLTQSLPCQIALSSFQL